MKLRVTIEGPLPPEFEGKSEMEIKETLGADIIKPGELVEVN